MDDNSDIRSYLTQNLQYSFQICEACNGHEAWQKILDLVPAVVVSDIMMPEMDGIQLCKLLKEDERTNHIPIILLTAKSAIEHRMEGLSVGADAYLSKPFHPRHLRIRIEKLIKLRITLRQKYLRELSDLSTTQSPALTPEEKFLAKVKDIIETQLTNTEFKVIHLERESGHEPYATVPQTQSPD